MGPLKQNTLYILVFAVCAAGVVIYSLSSAQKTTKHTNTLMEKKEVTWNQKILRKGGKAAYAELLTSIKEASPPEQHNEAHLFGGELYKVEGTAGLSVCDTNFGYGCFHQFMAEAIQSSGIYVVSTLNDVCLATESKSGCQHGIGHGLIAYFGYTEKSLTQAVSKCGTLTDADYIDGCINGVFMEYNLRAMIGNGDSSYARPANTGEWASQCASWTGIVRQSCSFSLPYWWWALLKNVFNTATFSRMGELCDSLGGASSERMCYEGIGQIAVGTIFNPKSSISMCEASSMDATKRLFCRTYAANVFLGTGSPEKALEMCTGLSGSFLAYCRAYAKGEASLQHELPAPEPLP